MSEGTTFGPYRVVRKLGTGGMGVVYLAEHALIGRRAAVKLLHPARSAQRDSVERFFNEARATSAVEDPGIVQIYDFGHTETGTAYLVMEYLDGEPLSRRLRRRGPLTPYDAVRITRQIAGSLAAVHALGIVHRDLKPENLFMVRDGEALSGERPKILDFGIAKLGDKREGGNLTLAGAVMGTPAYMSPEQCNDLATIDHRTDIYSLGCVLFHLLTGQPPFDLEGVGTIFAAHLREPAPAPSTIARQVPAMLDVLVARCLAKCPEDRFSTMLELQRACDAVMATLPESDVVPSSSRASTLGSSRGESPGVTRPIRRATWIALGAVAVVAGVALAAATTPRAVPERAAAAAATASTFAGPRLPVHPPAPPTSAAPSAAPSAARSVAGAPPAAAAGPVSPPASAAASASPPPQAHPPAPAHRAAVGRAAKKPRTPLRDLYEDRI